MENFPLIIGVTWLAVISPGADFAMISRISFTRGPQDGLLASIGIALSCWLHIFYAIFGLGLVERVAPNLLDVIKLIGAGYLIYIGATTALAPSKAAPDNAGRASWRGHSMLAGALTNGLNPKTAIFVISLYTQIIGPGRSLAFQLACGLFISVSHLVWFWGVSRFLSQPAIRERVLRHRRLFNAATGGVLVALGLGLAIFDVSPGAT